ncbi:MAG: sulfite exporter TauE/SafE family protein [Bacteriovoracaceae bacterium]|nr:sulfite exporter TauE/SafE family protein [Bacteriovoracaceae bacterium]
MIENTLTWFYFPTALFLGALHALEPGHSKALTAAYLIGIKGTKRDALLLGLSVAIIHSFVVVGISIAALWLGRETFTKDVTYWLQIGSGIIVIILGTWMLLKRLKVMKKSRPQNFVFKKVVIQSNKIIQLKIENGHDHSSMSDDEHERAHASQIPKYVKEGERPTLWQIITFGAAGGMIPCPASITVMLLALSIGKFSYGLLAVTGFSIGLAVTLVGVGLLVVMGLGKIEKSFKFQKLSSLAPVLSACLVIFSGLLALVFSH